MTTYTGEDVEPENTPSWLAENANLYSHFENEYGRFLENWESI